MGCSQEKTLNVLENTRKSKIRLRMAGGGGGEVGWKFPGSGSIYT
jgi:hypothetical protein